LEKIQALLYEVYGLKISSGGLSEMLSRLGGKMEPVHEALREKAGEQSVLNADETGWRVAGKTHWLWCFSSLNCLPSIRVICSCMSLSAAKRCKAKAQAVPPGPPPIITTRPWSVRLFVDVGNLTSFELNLVSQYRNLNYELQSSSYFSIRC